MFVERRDFYCPKCGKVASTANPMFRCYSVRHLQLPIFLCSDCRTIYINKPTIRKIVSEFRKEGMVYVEMSFEEMCRDILGKLERIMEIDFISYLGYKKVRFLKNP